MVSDGMSSGVLSMSEAFSQQVRSKGTVWWDLLSRPGVSHGLMDTASSNSLVTDSAAASSAWSSGKRVPNGHINVDDKGKSLESIGETLVKKKVRLGLVSTATITHATPAGFASNTPERNEQDKIAPQYLDRVDVILGGGARYFDPKRRKDKRDLFADYEKAKYDVVRSRDEMMKSKEKKILGTFSNDHMPYTIDHMASERLKKEVPTLAEMTEVALSRFLEDESPFLLQVEGARIDHAAHRNDIAALIHDQIAFDDAVAKALVLTEKYDDILIIITSDHGNANPGLNGTGARYRRTNDHFAKIAKMKCSSGDLLNKWRRTSKGKEDLMSIMEKQYGFRPSDEEATAVLDSIAGRNVTEWHHQLSNTVGLLGQIAGNETGTGWTGVSHTADPTQLTALGPSSETLQGLVRNDAMRDHFLNLLT